MGQVNKISSFKSFSEVKTQESSLKLREENNVKRQETAGKFGAILDEMGLNSLSELDETQRKELFGKMFGTTANEGNAFLGARIKAIEEENDEFEFNGKTYKVTYKTKKVTEGNAFGDAVRKAKEAGDKEFEFEGKTFKVEEALVNEGGTAIYSRVGPHIGELRQELRDLIQSAEDDKWIKALQSIENELDKFDKFIDKFDSKLGIINTNESEISEAFSTSQKLVVNFVNRLEKEFGLPKDEIVSFIIDTLRVMGFNVNEGNAFGDAVRKAKEAGDKEFEFEGKTFKVEEALVNEGRGTSALEKYVKSKYKDQRVNSVTFEELLEPIAIHIDAYTGATMGDLEYNSNVINDFKKLTDSMAQAHIDGSDLDESKVNEAKNFQSSENWDDFLEEIDRMPENRIRRIMGKDYIDTPGGYADEKDDYDTIEDYMISNMGSKEYGNLEDWWIKNVRESVTNESDSRSLNKIEADLNMLMKGPDNESTDASINSLEKIYRKKGGKKSLAEIEKLDESKVNEGAGVDEASAFMAKDVIKTVDFLNRETGGKPGYLFFGEDTDIAQFDKLWASRKYQNALDMLAQDREIEAQSFDDVKIFVKESASVYEKTKLNHELEHYLSSKFIDESALSDIDLLAKDSKDFKDFVKNFKRDYKNLNTGNTKELEAWLKTIYDVAIEESLVNEANIFISNLTDIDHTRILKWMSSQFYQDQVNVKKKGSSGNSSLNNYIINTDKLSKPEIEDLKSYLKSANHINEAEIKSDDEFKEYAFSVLKKAFASDFDEEKAQEVVDGILKKSDGDYGAAIGILTSSLG